MLAPTPTYHAADVHSTLDDWIVRDAIAFSVDSVESFNAAVDRLIGTLGDAVELIGFGEALHGGEDILLLRNRLFQQLVEAHGFSAIAIESSFPRAAAVNEYMAGRGTAALDSVLESGFSHGFGQLEANRELVEWMRAYNAEPSARVKLRFYGFDSPTEMMSSDSPRALLEFAIKYLEVLDAGRAREIRERIEPLLGNNADWENPAAMMDPTKSVGGTAAAAELRMATEELIAELHTRRPEFVAASDNDRYVEAVQYARLARHLLNYHAAVARPSSRRTAELLGLRDWMMADNLAYIVERERGRGRVLVFAHNSHLKYGQAEWQLGADLLTWWPVGSHLREMLGPRYAVIGSGIGVSEANGILAPESGTLEARLTAVPGPARFIPTHRGEGLPSPEIAALPTRSGSTKNPTYFPLTGPSFTDFDWLVVLDSTAYSRGGPPLP